jgi:hypothetical protein
MWGAARTVLPDQIVRVVPRPDRIGGLTALGEPKQRRILFRANRASEDYRELVAWIRARRPDLDIPLAARPLPQALR